MKTIESILIVSLIAAILILAVRAYGYYQQAGRLRVEVVALRNEACRVPTIEDIQRKIGAVEDGIMGQETLAKWDLAVCNQYAKPYFTQSGVPENVKNK